MRNRYIQKHFLIVIISLLYTASFAKDFKGAEYRTKLAYTYGRFETRLMSAGRDGILSSFFTYHEQTSTSQWNEIDIEIMGRYSDNAQFNAITPGQINHVHAQFTGFNPHNSFHVYAFEWAPTYVAWFIDGVEVHRQTGSHIASLTLNQKIMMNIWNPTAVNWAGVWNPAVLPTYAYYDWVKYYSYTPGSGNYGSGNNFSILWTDDFNSFDQTRWEKATHTFEGNGCDFVPENAVFSNGCLVLCLTKAGNLGINDIDPPSILWSRAIDSARVMIAFSEELDTLSCTTKTNYIIPNATVNGARLNADQKSVTLDVAGLNLNQPTNILIQNIKDRSPARNTLSLKSVALILPAPLSFPIKINCGGNSVNGYLADQEWKETSEYGFLDGSTSTFSSSLVIYNTNEPIIYRSDKNNLVCYNVRVPNGKYNVKILLAENTYATVNSRVFDVTLQGQKIAENLDVFGVAGKNTAYILSSENVVVTDDILSIHFGAEKESGFINGLIIEKVVSGVKGESQVEPNQFKLGQNYPNPFSGKTKIKYAVSNPGEYYCSIYSITGEEIFSSILGHKEKGEYILDINRNAFKSSLNASGIYFFRLSSKFVAGVCKLVLVN